MKIINNTNYTSGDFGAIVLSLLDFTRLLASFGNDKLVRANLLFIESLFYLLETNPSVVQVFLCFDAPIFFFCVCMQYVGCSITSDRSYLRQDFLVIFFSLAFVLSLTLHAGDGGRLCPAIVWHCMTSSSSDSTACFHEGWKVNYLVLLF